MEANGLATVSIAAIRGIAERLRPPRALYCEFPLGWPVGRPNDPELQRRVLETAFAMLTETSGPVLRDYPEAIADDSDAPLTCRLAGRSLRNTSPAEEAIACRAAYDQHRATCGRTLVGRTITADGVPGAIAAFIAIADGVPWRQTPLPGLPAAVAMDIRAYFEEAALGLSGEHVGARAAESWFYKRTGTGRLLLRVRKALIAAGEPQDIWYGTVPRTQI